MLGKFIKVVSNKFDGLYKYEQFDDRNNYIIFNNLDVDEGTYTILDEQLSNENYVVINNLLVSAVSVDEPTFGSLESYLLEKIDDTTYKAYFWASGSDASHGIALGFYQDYSLEPSQSYLCTNNSYSSYPENNSVFIYTIDLLNSTATQTKKLTTGELKTAKNTYYMIDEVITSDRKFILSNSLNNFCAKPHAYIEGGLDISSRCLNFAFPIEKKYHPANTQLTSFLPVMLEKNCIVLGENGVCTGTRAELPYGGISIDNCTCLNTSRSYAIYQAHIFALRDRPDDEYYYFGNDPVYIMLQCSDKTGYPYKSWDELRNIKITLKDDNDDVVYEKSLINSNGNLLYHEDFSSVFSREIMYKFAVEEEITTELLNKARKLEITFLDFE